MHINIYYIQFYITFQYIHHMTSGISHGGSGPGMGQGHPPCQFMSIWCLLLQNYTFIPYIV